MRPWRSIPCIYKAGERGWKPEILRGGERSKSAMLPGQPVSLQPLSVSSFLLPSWRMYKGQVLTRRLCCHLQYPLSSLLIKLQVQVKTSLWGFPGLHSSLHCIFQYVFYFCFALFFSVSLPQETTPLKKVLHLSAHWQRPWHTTGAAKWRNEWRWGSPLSSHSGSGWFLTSQVDSLSSC